MAEIVHSTYKKAFRDLTIKDAKKGFRAHLTSYIIMNTILVAINLATDPGKLWFLGSVIGWGIGVIAHYIGGVAILEKKTIKLEDEAEAMAAETAAG